MNQDISGTYNHGDYTIAIVCAMYFELSAIRYMLDREHSRLPTPDDDIIYTFGELHGHNVVLSCLSGKQGKGAAAIISTNIKHTFPSIKWRFLVGIGGGIPSSYHDIRLGDVVVSMPDGKYGGVVQYDLGRDMNTGFETKDFLWPTPTLLRSAVETMRSDHLVRENKIMEYLSAMQQRWPRLTAYKRPSEPDILYQEDYDHSPNAPSCAGCDPSQIFTRSPREDEHPHIHYGLIASGDRVLMDVPKRREALKGLGDVLCVEMEAAGLMSGYPCLVIRGISDYADSHKNWDWQHYAAATAAGCAKELISYISADKPPAPASTPSAAVRGDGPGASSVVFHGQGIQHTGSGTFSVGNDLRIG